ncbi:hypothetical protein [Paenibacillus allorhizoplanae]|uniref:hypothetical protein n=1 Tax=Paenibacillus allorhizoplanae TaxID=2905648 RepID=UPI001F31B334|nr:hypothetical protein [Paenibacillus allorhizoplanae]
MRIPKRRFECVSKAERWMLTEFILSLEVAYYGVRETGTAIEELGSTTTRR